MPGGCEGVFGVGTAAAGGLPANGSAAAPVTFLLQKQMHALGCAAAGQTSGGGQCGSGAPGFPSPPPAVAAGGGVTSHVAAGHAALATASSAGAPTTSSSAGGGTGQGVFGRCLCKGAAGGSRGRGSHAKSLKCKTCGNLSHVSCYSGIAGSAAQKFVCSTCRMKRLDPFYPVEEVLWETRLEGSHYTVEICAHVLRRWRAEGKEVIVRCMQIDQPVLYQTWPKSIQISINGRTEETVSAPSWEHKRRDTPIVITQYLKNGKNRVEFWWTNYEEAKPFHLALLLCTYSSPEILAKALELRSHVGEAEARRRVLSIVTNKNGSPGAQQDDDDVLCMEVTRRIKLLCPITFMRIDLPCRGANCMHLQCFDLSGYLLVTRNTKAFNTRWKCPECQLYVRPDELVIDDFVLQILKDTPEDATVIELEADGSYRVVSEQELKEESKRAEAQRLRAAGACRVKRAIDEETTSASLSATPAQQEDGPSKKAFEIVEMLSSSEDEEDALAIDSNSSAPPVASAMSTTTGAVAATRMSTLQAAVSVSAPAATPASTLRPEGAQAAAASLEASTTRALSPALVSSLQSAPAAASAAAAGGLLFSPAATAGSQQQQQESIAAPTGDDRYACSPEKESEEQEDDEDSAIRVGRFHKRLRRAALSPASSPASPALVGHPASSLQQQQEIVPGDSGNEGVTGAPVATDGSVGRRFSTRAGVRAVAQSCARAVVPKAQVLAAAECAPVSAKKLEGQQQPSAEGGDIVVISSDDEEELVAAAWTPVLTPQQQRRQLRRQQEDERRRLQEEKREEHRKLVAQAAAAAQQHARAEALSEETEVVEAKTKDQQNISFSNITALTLLSPPAATTAGKQTLLSNLQLNFPSTPQRAVMARSVSKDSESETRVGNKAAELLQLLLERQRQELVQREKLQMQEFKQHEQRLNLRRLTSLSSEEDTCHRPAPPFWQAPDRPGDSSKDNASEEKTSSNSGSENFAWSFGETAAAGRGGHPYDGHSREAVTAVPDSDSAAAGYSSGATNVVSADAAPPRSASTHRVSAAESSGFEQASVRLHDSTTGVLFAPDSYSAASFPGVIPPYSYPRAASPPTLHTSRETAGGVVVAVPSARPGGVGESSSFGLPAACLAPTGNYYYVDLASVNMASPSVLQQEHIFQQPAQQEMVQQPIPCGGIDDRISPMYGVDHSTTAESSHILETYSKAAQHEQPQQTFGQLQQQVQQVVQQNLQLQQHAEEQQRVQQQQRAQHQAAQHLRSLQQPYEPPPSQQTAEAAGAMEQLTCRDTPTTDIKEKEQTRSFTVRVTAGESEEKNTSYRSRRSSARGITSRSSSPDPGRREKHNEAYTSGGFRQLHPAAQGAPVEGTSLKADDAFATARDGVKSGLRSSERTDTDLRAQPPYEQQQQQQHRQQRKQQHQLPPLGTSGPVAGANNVSGSQAAPLAQASGTAAGARASTASHFVHSAAATAVPPAQAASHQQTSSAAADRKRAAADEASLPTANAEGADLTTSKRLERTKSSTAEGLQGAAGARRGPRMSLPPRSCVAGLRIDVAGTSKPAASTEQGKVGFSAAASATVSSTPSTLPIPSSAAMPRAGPASPTGSWRSQGHHSSLSRGTPGVAAAPAAVTSVARSADGAAAAASLVRAAAAGTPAAGTALPRSPGRRLLVPPVPPPLPSRSVKHAGTVSSSGQEECSSGSAQHGQSGSFVNLSDERSSSSNQRDPGRNIFSCSPAAAAAIAAAASSTGGVTSATATSTTVPSSPGLTSPSDGTTAAAPICTEAGPGVRTNGRLATHTGASNAPSQTCWSSHRSINTDDGRVTGVFSEVASCGAGLNKQRSDSAGIQHGSSSNNSGSSGHICSTESMHSTEEVERVSSDMRDPPTAAGGGCISACPVGSPRRFRVDLRRHSRTRIKDDDADHADLGHSGRDVNVNDCRTNSCSRRQSGSVARNPSECSPSSSGTTGYDQRNLHEVKGAVTYCTTIETSDREQEALLRRPSVDEHEFSAVHHAGQACAESSRLMRRERNAGTAGSEAELCTSGGEFRTMQTAGVADITETAELQRTDSAIAAATADEAPRMPRQRESGRCLVSVVFTHHAANHVKPPPAGFFSTADSVTPSPSASPVIAGQTDSDEAHTATDANRSISDSETAQSQLRAQQTDDGTDSPCLNAPSRYAPALSANFHASSPRQVTEAELIGLDAGGSSTVARVGIPADGLHSEGVPFTGVSASMLNTLSPESNWNPTFLSDSCSQAAGAFPSSLRALTDRTTGVSSTGQEQRFLQSVAEELEQQPVPIRSSEAHGAEQQHSGIRSADGESKLLARSEDVENLLLAMPLSHTSSQLQPRARQILEWQQDARSATPHVDIGSAACFTETPEPGEWKANEKAGTETEGYICSEGIASENFEEAAAGHQEISREGEA